MDEFKKWWANNFASEPVVTPVEEVARQAYLAGRQEQRELDADWLQAYGFVEVDAAIRRGAATTDNIKSLRQERVKSLPSWVKDAIRQGKP